jgi:hypothetical protein
VRVVRKAATLGFTAAALLGAAQCASGGSGGGTGGGGADAACTVIARLADSVALVDGADVADPERFEKALDDAVADYVLKIEKLRELTPDELHDDLDRLQAAVEQYDFDEALAARAPLDDYAASECEAETTVVTG